MKIQTTTIVKNFTPKTHPNCIDVVVTIGGLMAEIVKYHGRRRSTQTFMFDNPTDLSYWNPIAQDLGINTVALGQGHTTATLAEKESEYVRSVFRRVAAMNATTGCGASPLVGYLVAKDRVVLGDFRLLLRRTAATIRAITNGTPSMIRLRIKCSSCGGTGSGGFRPVTEAFIRELVKLGVNVQVELDLTGSFTFGETSDQCRLTAAAVLPAAVAFILDRSDRSQNRVTKHLMLGEYPSATEKEVRDTWVLFEEVALTCPQFRDVFELIRPNQSTKSIFGNVTIKETDFYCALDLIDDIAAEVAASYLDLVEAAVDSIVPDSTLINQLEYVDQVTDLKPKPIEEIAQSINQFEVETLLEAIKKPEHSYVYRLYVTMTRGSRYDTSNLRAVFVNSPETLSDTIEVSKLIETFQERLQTEAASIQATIESIEHDLAQQEAKFKVAHDKLTSKRLWAWRRRQIFSQMLDTAQNLRSLTDDLANQEAARLEVMKALRDLSNERELLRNRMNSVVNMLRSFMPNGSTSSHKKTIVPNEIEGVFSELVKVLRRPRRQQAECLRLCAGLVTIDGLARIVGAHLPQVDDIAQALVTRTPMYPAVPHGGVGQQDATNTVYVLPPVEDHLEQALTTKIRELRLNAKTVFTHTLAGGANAIRFRFRFPSAIEEIMCGNLPYDFQEVLESEHSDLMFPGDYKYVEQAGLRIDGTSFYFTDPTPPKLRDASEIKGN